LALGADLAGGGLERGCDRLPDGHPHSGWPPPSVARTWVVEPLRWSVMVTRWPWRNWPISTCWRGWASSSFTSSMAVITSPDWTPASAAGPPAVTVITSAPGAVPLSAASEAVTCAVSSPSEGTTRRPSRTICSTSVWTSWALSAKPVWRPALTVSTATPTTWPATLRTGAPEMAGSLTASVWKVSERVCWEAELTGPATLIARWRAAMIPASTTRPPSGVPTTTTDWPARTVVVSPKASVGSRETPSTLSTATSVWQAESTSRASCRVASPAKITVRPVALATTWALVTMYPSLVVRKPEPIPPPWPVLPVTIVATAGDALSAT